MRGASGRSFSWWVGLLLLAAPAFGDGSVRCFTAVLPEGWREAQRVMLLVKDVRVPQKQSAIFRVRTVDADGSDVLLGSFAVVAEAQDVPGITRHPVFLINITRTLSRWGAAHPQESHVNVRIVPVDGKGRTLETFDWSAREVLIERR